MRRKLKRRRNISLIPSENNEEMWERVLAARDVIEADYALDRDGGWHSGFFERPFRPEASELWRRSYFVGRARRMKLVSEKKKLFRKREGRK